MTTLIITDSLDTISYSKGFNDQSFDFDHSILIFNASCTNNFNEILNGKVIPFFDVKLHNLSFTKKVGDIYLDSVDIFFKDVDEFMCYLCNFDEIVLMSSKTYYNFDIRFYQTLTASKLIDWRELPISVFIFDYNKRITFQLYINCDEKFNRKLKQLYFDWHFNYRNISNYGVNMDLSNILIGLIGKEVIERFSRCPIRILIEGLVKTEFFDFDNAVDRMIILNSINIFEPYDEDGASYVRIGSNFHLIEKNLIDLNIKDSDFILDYYIKNIRDKKYSEWNLDNLIGAVD